jgi:hypothetical protein
MQIVMVAALVTEVQSSMLPTFAQNKPLPYHQAAMSKTMYGSGQRIYAGTLAKVPEGDADKETGLAKVGETSTALGLPNDPESYALITNQGTGEVAGVVGVPKLVFRPPVAKPSLYSQGIMGKPTRAPKLSLLPYDHPNAGAFSWGKGLIGKGALLGGPYKPPEAKPSLYSQGIKGKKVYKPPQPAYGTPEGWGSQYLMSQAAEKTAPVQGESGAGVEELAAQTPVSALVLPMAFFAGTAFILTMLRFHRSASGKREELLSGA